MSSTKGPGLYEFLLEAELQQYFGALKNDLKVVNVSQLKFVTDEDLIGLGMSKPEIRRLKKYFSKHYPQTYYSKFMKIILPKKDGPETPDVVIPADAGDRPAVKVPSKYIIPAEAIVINKELGVGEFGVVQQGVWTDEEGGRIQVAIKCLSKDRMQNQPMEFLKEAAIMHSIDSEHIVRLYGVVLDTASLMLVTELAPLRSLLECLKEPSLRVSFPVTSLSNFSVQICDGMTYLENKRLIHRDLAARNILVFSKDKVKISDFGLSRALGVGKDYYQTNFNVNLKLPIAWCAPECINYLRFTSASDVWAYGVTLWEMFSYGFQPWAALTGQQILEAIDEPNFQRLDQPDACPKEYYSIMLKCWQHDPLKRLKFVDLINLLSDSKPEQVQVVREEEDPMLIPAPQKLAINVGDIVTILDKRPLQDDPTIWKAVTNNGKTGLFNAANSIAYLGKNIPNAKSMFNRGDGKNAYSSRRRLRTEMISGPQGDFKHTGHVGLDGAYFGDIAFLGDKYHKLPKQIVTPYKPSEDHDDISLTRASSDVSDRTPLLKKVGEKGKFGPASDPDWNDATNDEINETQKVTPSTNGHGEHSDHEYHEISDEDDVMDTKKESGRFASSAFDMGPSLMDEVFKALDGDTPSRPPSAMGSSKSSLDVSSEKSFRCDLRDTFYKGSVKRKQATVKPISASDEKTLDTAIAMAHELAAQSMSDMNSAFDFNRDSNFARKTSRSPTPPPSPGKTSKFPFKMSRSSPKQERRLFSAEANSIQDIQSCISAEAKEVYNSLVDGRSLQRDSMGAASSNPLRMLRSGVTVRPKVRGNKHNASTLERNVSSTGFDPSTHQTLPRGFKHSKVPPPVKPKPVCHQAEDDDPLVDDANNPLPLPPRDRSKGFIAATRSRHQRKYPLLIPGAKTNALLRGSGMTIASADKNDSSPRLLIQHTHNPLLESQSSASSTLSLRSASDSNSPKVPPEKPPRLYQSPESLDDSFESQVAFEMDALDGIPVDPAGVSPPGASPPSFPTEEASVFVRKDSLESVNGRGKKLVTGRSLYQSGDHVSCEDLLDFAMDKPNSKRTQGPTHGIASDEVHILKKVLQNKVSDEECVETLNACEWEVHKALKILNLKPLVQNLNLSYVDAKETLDNFSWDISKSKAYLSARSSVDQDTTQV